MMCFPDSKSYAGAKFGSEANHGYLSMGSRIRKPIKIKGCMYLINDNILPEGLLVLLDAPLGLGVGGVGVLQGGLQVAHVRLKLLFHAKSLCLTFHLCLHNHLHAFKGIGKVLLG